MAEFDAALVQPVFHISEREREPDVHHYRQADNLGAAMKVLERITFRHPGTLQSRPARLKQNPSDTARGIGLKIRSGP